MLTTICKLTVDEQQMQVYRQLQSIIHISQAIPAKSQRGLFHMLPSPIGLLRGRNDESLLGNAPILSTLAEMHI